MIKFTQTNGIDVWISKDSIESFTPMANKTVLETKSGKTYYVNELPSKLVESVEEDSWTMWYEGNL